MKERCRGFTLVEVMVAIAVLAIAMAAVIKASTEMTDNARYLQERTFTHWVASNVLADLQARRFWSDTGQSGVQALGGHRWHWAFEVEDTPNPEFRRIDVSVYRDSTRASPLVTVTGLVANPGLGARARAAAREPGE